MVMVTTYVSQWTQTSVFCDKVLGAVGSVVPGLTVLNTLPHSNELEGLCFFNLHETLNAALDHV